jgi:PAS domain S-box-containing protein
MDESPDAGFDASDFPAPVVVTDISELLGPVIGEPTRVELLARVTALEGKLATLPAIEQAKGALMATYGLTADAAFALLRFHSQHRNMKIRAIAAQLTTLMSTAVTGAEAIARFNRLLDQVSEDMSTAVAPPTQTQNASVAGPDEVLAPVIAPEELPEVTLRAVAAAPPGITIVGNDPDLPVVYANDAFTEITGYPMGQVLGRNCRFLQGPDTDPRDVTTIRLALQKERDVSVVLRNYKSDGLPFWNEVSISPIRNRADQVTHYVGTQIDITDRIDHTESSGHQP